MGRAGFHTFRHTVASRLFAPRWLGHHAASFSLDTYVHLLEGDMEGRNVKQVQASPDGAPGHHGVTQGTDNHDTGPEVELLQAAASSQDDIPGQARLRLGKPTRYQLSYVRLEGRV